MTELEKQEIVKLHNNGYSYSSIAKQLNVSVNSIKVAVHRYGLLDGKSVCKQCNH